MELIYNALLYFAMIDKYMYKTTIHSIHNSFKIYIFYECIIFDVYDSHRLAPLLILCLYDRVLR